MTQQQFSVLDALIVAQIGTSGEKELAIWAALAIGLATSLALTASAQLQTLALDVWG